MEFWGVEVPSGKPLTCQPGPVSYVHVSQAALGDNKNAKGNDRVVLKVKVGTNEVVVGTLSHGKCDQTTLDLIFEKEFILSHNSSGSVYFCGYKTDAVRDDDSMSSGSDDDEFDVELGEDELGEELVAKENGKLVKPGKADIPAIKSTAKAPAPKHEVPVADSKSKAKTAVAEKGKGAKEKGSEDDEEDDEDEEDSDEDEDMMGSDSDDEDLESDEDESDDEESEEEKPKSAGKKRPAPALLAASTGKKGKNDTPGKAEPKTPSVPVSTPKQQQSGKKDQSAKKTPGKENSNTPTSGKKLGQYLCQPCNKNFNSESALTQHKTAKHKS